MEVNYTLLLHSLWWMCSQTMASAHDVLGTYLSIDVAGYCMLAHTVARNTVMSRTWKFKKNSWCFTSHTWGIDLEDLLQWPKQCPCSLNKICYLCTNIIPEASYHRPALLAEGVSEKQRAWQGGHWGVFPASLETLFVHFWWAVCTLFRLLYMRKSFHRCSNGHHILVHSRWASPLQMATTVFGPLTVGSDFTFCGLMGNRLFIKDYSGR